MADSNSHLSKLHSLVGEFAHKSGDEVIGQMLPELGSLIVTLSEELDSAQRKVIKLTWAMLWLAFIMAIIGGVQLFVSINPAQQQVTDKVPNKADSTNGNHQQINERK